MIAAYLRTIFNGWCTSHRFQGAGPCRFACGGGRDKLEHFAFCPKVKALFSEFHLPPSASGLELDTFLGLQELPVQVGTSPATLCHRQGVALYALYRLHGALRHGVVEAAHIPGAFKEFCRQGATGVDQNED